MELPTRHLFLGATLGAICASALAMTGPGMVVEAFADDLLTDVIAPGFDTSKLVRFEGKKYIVEHEDWVATDPLSTAIVKKVEGGRVSYVTIATTATGTYSSDAMFSNHVQYPGISVERWPGYRPGGSFYYWGGNRGYSFFSVRAGSTRITTWGGMTCVSGKGFSVC